MIFPAVFSVEVLEEVAVLVGSLIVPVVGKALGLEGLFDSIGSTIKKRKSPSPTGDLVTRLRSASSEMDSVIKELEATADEKLTRVAALEGSINELIEKEKNLKEKIQGTEGLSKATVETLGKIVEKQLEKVETPKKRRDYALFAAGVLVSTVVGIGIEATKPIWVKMLHLPVESTVKGESHPPINGTVSPVDQHAK
jgi:hypothetical protein